MLTVTEPHVYGIADALRGMRNPLNSWSKNDSKCVCDVCDGHVISVELGPNDERLCKTLIIGGSPHRKYLRQMFVTMDISAPMYWWAEMDTYKASTTRNSCSVQHKGASRDFVIDDFTVDGLETEESLKLSEHDCKDAVSDMNTVVEIVNKWRKMYVDGNKENYDYFRVMRQLLPSGYNYKATWSGNYENLLNIYEWRHNHKLREWHTFCGEIEKLPLMNIFLKTTKEGDK